MATLLEDILANRTKDQEESILLSVFQEEDFPVSDWNVGGVARTMAKAIAAAMLDKYQLAQVFAKGQLSTLAKELKDELGAELRVWMDTIAENFYFLERAQPTHTIQRCTLSCALGFGPIDIENGYIAKAKSGRRYIYQGASVVTVPDNDSAKIDLTAEEAGSRYADPAGDIFQSVTDLPGLSITNAGEKFGGLNLNGTARKNVTAQGTGTITPTASGTPVEKRHYTATITATGDAGTSGTIKIEYISAGVVTAVATITPIPTTYSVGDGITLTIANGAGVGFVSGDVHTFQTPGSPIIQQGVDYETNEQLYERILGRFPSLSVNAINSKYLTWIREASLANGLGIAKITPRASATEAGVTNILVATASGAPPAGTITVLQEFVDLRTGIGEKAFVFGATDVGVPIAGTVTVKAANYVAARAAADENWRQYVTALPIGGDLSTGSPGVVRLYELVQVLMDAGAIDLSGIQLDGAAANLALAEDETAVVESGQEPSAALTWNTVT